MEQNKVSREGFWCVDAAGVDEMENYLNLTDSNSESMLSLGDGWYTLICC